jgi:heparan-alpha-glucosaminide N-acetyltransferase
LATVLEPQPLVSESPKTETRPTAPPLTRNIAVDAYRGFVMLLMMAEVLQFSRVSATFPTSWFWKILAYNQTHVDWAGCSLHDLIQPSF